MKRDVGPNTSSNPVTFHVYTFHVAAPGSLWEEKTRLPIHVTSGTMPLQFSNKEGA